MKKVVAVVIATLMVAVLMTGCTESEQFRITSVRKLTTSM